MKMTRVYNSFQDCDECLTSLNESVIAFKMVMSVPSQDESVVLFKTAMSA
jgi:hypothetical protein